jgi:hypothetical protein
MSMLGVKPNSTLINSGNSPTELIGPH